MKIVLDLKVVMDTNVFISGVFFSGLPYQILQAWQSGRFELVASREILDEYRRVGKILAQEHSKINLNPILTFVFEHAKVYRPARLKEPVCEDPDDKSSLPAPWQAEAGSLSAATSIC